MLLDSSWHSTCGDAACSSGGDGDGVVRWSGGAELRPVAVVGKPFGLLDGGDEARVVLLDCEKSSG